MPEIYDYLDSTGITFVRHDHKAVYTVQEADQHADTIPGISAKTLLVFGEKTKKFYLISIEGHKKLEQPIIKAILGERVRFSSPEDLQRILRTTPGSVSPLGLIFDTVPEIDCYVIDQQIIDADNVTWHPNDNTQTLQFNNSMNKKFIDTLVHEVKIYK